MIVYMYPDTIGIRLFFLCIFMTLALWPVLLFLCKIFRIKYEDKYVVGGVGMGISIAYCVYLLIKHVEGF